MKHRPYTHGLVLVIIFLAVGYATITGGTFQTKSHAFAAPITGLTLPGVSSSIPTSDQSTLRPEPVNKTLRADTSVPPAQAEEARRLAAIDATPTAQPPAPAEDAVVRAAAVAPPPPAVTKPYTVYDVQDGDTISSIAARNGLKAQTLIDNNAEIQDSDFLKLGQSIIIPAGDGIVYEIRLGETLSDIAERFGVTPDAIVNSPVNGITTPDDIKESQYVFVPGGTMPAAAPLAVAAPTPDAGSSDSDSSDSGGASASAGIVAGGPKSSKGLIWPVVGPISSPYGPSHPLGIDIDGYNLVGHPVAAATDGTVVFAGGNACCSYGLYVVVMSPGGIETLYAHLSSIVVSQGQTVSQGEELGIIGTTGYSTGTHLHFEVIDNGVRQNPIDYLP
jgi:murein DD-endopeptidase MepM/ murein hydrolase activator NlpD